MFTSARLKLTTWYLLIIMLISVSFSLGIYALINDDYNRLEATQQARIEREARLQPYYDFYRQQLEAQGLPVPNMPIVEELESINDARIRLQAVLVLINLAILLAAGVAGYFLAGRTLKPIQVMVDDQNRFISDASHELRTPLTSLRSEIEVYLRDKKLTLKDAKDLLQSNLEEVNKLQYLSDNLIKLTKHQFNDLNTLAVISLVTIVDEAIRKVMPLARKKKIEIQSKIEDLSIEGELQSLTELLVILLDNAIKYSLPNTLITLKTHRLDHSVQIQVQDQGLGIAKEDLPHIFDRFYRADKSRSKTAGHGLGLSIAKQIIEKHHGTIKVESEVGKGTTFIIQLPLNSRN